MAKADLLHQNPICEAYWISPALVKKVQAKRDHKLPEKRTGSPIATYNHDHAVSTEPHHRV